MQRLRCMCVVMCSVGEECTQEVADLLERCIRTNVNERPTAKEIVAALQVTFLFTPTSDTHNMQPVISR